jgi:hypothetical protein
MSDNSWETVEKLEKLAAWHRINAESAEADWVWEARLRTAVDLERRAAAIRTQLPNDWDRSSAVPEKYTRGNRETGLPDFLETRRSDEHPQRTLSNVKAAKR